MKSFSICLVGQPNVGKSSLINAISGAKLRVGNFSGVTVERAEAVFKKDDYEIKIIDLPGTYSLNGYTLEERVTNDFLKNGQYDLILNVADVTNLQRNLLLTLQLQELKKPMLLALNMIDEAQIEGISTDYQKLSQLLGIGVCGVSSTRGQNLDTLINALIKTYENSKNYSGQNISFSTLSPVGNPDIFVNKAAKAKEIVNASQQIPRTRAKNTTKIDKIILHKVYGIPIFLLMMLIVFQLSFIVGGYLQGIIEDWVGLLADFVSENIENEFISSLVGDGIISGVGTVISFLPLISILFLGITILEGSGYMSRVAFLLDGLFFKFGLHGKSFIPLITGFGCSVPAYMATRTLQNKTEKLITLFIIGFMSCSARLPIYTLFIATFFPNKYAGLILFAIYIGGAMVALICAKILKLTTFKGTNEPFVMEMPKYRFPMAKVIWFSVWSKSFMFIKKAGTVILLGAVFVWFISQFPKSEAINEEFTQKIQSVQNDKALDESIQKSKIVHLENELKERQLEYSIAGKLGAVLTPIFSPLGFDWRLSVSLITGFSAKEIVVSTLGVLYSLGDKAEDDTKSLQEVLKNNIAMSASVAFIMFIMFYIPCFAATISFTQESGNKKYTFYLFLFTTAVAYICAFIGHSIATLFV